MKYNFAYSLLNASGTLCTVLGKKYICTTINDSPVLVNILLKNAKREYLSEKKYNQKDSSDDSTSSLQELQKYLNLATIVWVDGCPVLLEKIADGMILTFDAIFLKKKGYYAVLIWTGTKPVSLPVMNAAELLLVEQYTNISVRCVSFDAGSPTVFVSIEGHIMKIPFSYHSVTFNGKKFKSHEEMLESFSISNMNRPVVKVCKLISLYMPDQYLYICSDIYTGNTDLVDHRSELHRGTLFTTNKLFHLMSVPHACRIYFDVKVGYTHSDDTSLLSFMIENRYIQVKCDNVIDLKVVKNQKIEGIAHIFYDKEAYSRNCWRVLLLKLEVSEATVTSINHELQHNTDYDLEAESESEGLFNDSVSSLNYGKLPNNSLKSGKGVDKEAAVVVLPGSTLSCDVKHAQDSKSMVEKINNSVNKANKQDNRIMDPQKPALERLSIGVLGKTFQKTGYNRKNEISEDASPALNNSKLYPFLEDFHFDNIPSMKTFTYADFIQLENILRCRLLKKEKHIPCFIKQGLGKIICLDLFQSSFILTKVMDQWVIMFYGNATNCFYNGLLSESQAVKFENGNNIFFDAVLQDNLGSYIPIILYDKQPDAIIVPVNDHTYYYNVTGIYKGREKESLYIEICLSTVTEKIRASVLYHCWDSEYVKNHSLSPDSVIQLHLRRAHAYHKWEILFLCPIELSIACAKSPTQDLQVTSDRARFSDQTSCQRQGESEPLSYLMKNQQATIARKTFLEVTLAISLPDGSKHLQNVKENKPVYCNDTWIPIGTLPLNMKVFFDGLKFKSLLIILVWVTRKPTVKKTVYSSLYFDVPGMVSSVDNQNLIINAYISSEIRYVNLKANRKLCFDPTGLPCSNIKPQDIVLLHIEEFVVTTVTTISVCSSTAAKKYLHLFPAAITSSNKSVTVSTDESTQLACRHPNILSDNIESCTANASAVSLKNDVGNIMKVRDLETGFKIDSVSNSNIHNDSRISNSIDFSNRGTSTIGDVSLTYTKPKLAVHKLPDNKFAREQIIQSSDGNKVINIYNCSGKIIFVSDQDQGGILAVRTAGRKSKSKAYCYFSQNVCYFNRKSQAMKEHTDFIKEVRIHIELSTVISADVYECEEQNCFDYNANYSVIALWTATKPSIVPVTILKTPVNVRPYCINSADRNCTEKQISTEKQLSTYSTEDLDNFPAPCAPVTTRKPKEQNSEKSSCVGRVKEISETGGELEGPGQKSYTFIRDQCFLYGLSIYSFPLHHIVKVGCEVEFELTDTGFMNEVWIGGGPQKNEETTYENILQWCKLYSVPSEIKFKLLTESGWIPPNCEPIIKKDSTVEVISLG